MRVSVPFILIHSRSPVGHAINEHQVSDHHHRLPIRTPTHSVDINPNIHVVIQCRINDPIVFRELKMMTTHGIMMAIHPCTVCPFQAVVLLSLQNILRPTANILALENVWRKNWTITVMTLPYRLRDSAVVQCFH
jgi:hypothetical protein